MIRGVVFDLDDTLYFERTYVQSGFREVAKLVSSVVKGLSCQLIVSFLWENFEAGKRGNNFDLLLENFPEIRGKLSVPDLVNCYRNHFPKISLLPEAKEVITVLQNKGFKIGILSDGFWVTQRLKIEALGLIDFVDSIVLTDEWGCDFWKPHCRGYIAIAEALGITHNMLCYVGDNPEKDFRCANTLGWYTVRFRAREQLRYNLEPREEIDAPQVTIENLKYLIELI